MSALLNHADGYWRPGPGGILSTSVVRRERMAREADEKAATLRAEIVPVTMTVEGDGAGGTRTVSVDLTHLSSWALAGQPARIEFGPDGRPRQVTSRLMFGTSVAVRFR
jgi:hypothetical protein